MSDYQPIEIPPVDATRWDLRLPAMTARFQLDRAALAATPVGHPDRAAALSNLGIDLMLMYRETGDARALSEAVAAHRAARAELIAQRRVDPAILLDLGATLMAAAQSGDAVAVEAEATLREALDAAPAGAPSRDETRCRILVTLSNFIWTSWIGTDEDARLFEAVALGREALTLASPESESRTIAQANLVPILNAVFHTSADPAVLDEAVRVGRAAARATSPRDPERARRLIHLGRVSRTLYEKTASAAMFEEALAALREAGELASSDAVTRVTALREAAILAGGAGGRAQEALALAEHAVQMLPLIVATAGALGDRVRQLGLVESLAGVAAATAIAAGQPVRAVELLEKARGVLLADALNDHDDDVARLRAAAPALAERLAGLRSHTRAPDVATSGGSAAEAVVAERLATQAEWDAAVTEIRSMAGFTNFLDVGAVEELAAHADEGPVVFVTTSPIGCHALIVSAQADQPVRTVPLLDLSDGDLERTVTEFVGAWTAVLSADNDNRLITTVGHATMFRIFRWMWDTIAEPVLTELGHTGPPESESGWPRIWWCPTGYLAFLPLHAAGYHTDVSPTLNDDPALRANPRTVLDRVISSYTTSLRRFAHAHRRGRAARAVDGPVRTLIVAVPDPPGLPPLASATTESENITALIPGAHALRDPGRDVVVAALPDHEVAHFACHAVADWSTPGASRLILDDWEHSPLTVADISGLGLDQGLAFLAACETLVTDPAIADEALHLTGAFHAAGYRHVIGTLWPVRDRATRKLAEDFYRRLTDGGRTRPDVDRSATALHHAVRRTRELDVTGATMWAAYTHTGA